MYIRIHSRRILHIALRGVSVNEYYYYYYYYYDCSLNTVSICWASKVHTPRIPYTSEVLG
jgi:hypothetical protein